MSFIASRAKEMTDASCHVDRSDKWWSAARTAMLAVLCGLAMSVPTNAKDIDDIALVAQWFEGDFDNSAQIERLGTQLGTLDEKDKHQLFHVRNRRIDLPELGEYVFYIEEYTGGDPANIYRQRIGVFERSGEGDAVIFRQGFLNEAERYAGAIEEPQKLASLTAADVNFMDELVPGSRCDVALRRNAEVFSGSMPHRGCAYDEGDEYRYIVYEVTIARDRYTRVDTAIFFNQGTRRTGPRVDIPYILLPSNH